jgi:flagellin
MVINTNVSALTTAQYLNQSETNLSTALAQLSSGSKITSPADDSAGYAVSLQLQSQMGNNTAASNNIADANSLLQTQDGYLQQVSSALDRMSELAVQAQDVTKSDSDRSLYNQEYQTLASFVNDIGTKDFNGVSLFNGDTLNVTTDSAGDVFAMGGINLSSTSYTNATSDDVNTIADAQTALTDVQTAINQLAADSATVGANQERLTMYSNTLSTLNNNLAAANSQIMDVNVAQASTSYAQANILVQTGTAMLAQANAIPNLALKLIGA